MHAKLSFVSRLMDGGVAPVTTRNEATPGNEAKKTLPENVANFVGGYIFWEPHTQK